MDEYPQLQMEHKGVVHAQTRAFHDKLDGFFDILGLSVGFLLARAVAHEQQAKQLPLLGGEPYIAHAHRLIRRIICRLAFPLKASVIKLGSLAYHRFPQLLH